MSSSSLAKFSNVLGSVREQAPAAPSSPQPLDPTTNILRLLLGGMIPVSDLAERTQLPANDILQTVEKLRDRQQVEIVEIPDQPGKKFIRLTKTGYAVFAA